MRQGIELIIHKLDDADVGVLHFINSTNQELFSNKFILIPPTTRPHSGDLISRWPEKQSQRFSINDSVSGRDR